MRNRLRSRLRALRESGSQALGLAPLVQGNRSFSQEGEDVLLQRIFAEQESGFYVDVGAHHPTRFSNTYWAYLRGWRGINLDPTPGSQRAFERLRPKDISLEVAVGETDEDVSLFAFSEGALNTTSLERRKQMESHLQEESQLVTVRQRTLRSVFEQLLHEEQVIDFLTIDVEGGEVGVLRGNDWCQYRPRLVLVETLGLTLDNWRESEVVQFLLGEGFTPMALLFHTLVLVGDDELRLYWKGT